MLEYETANPEQDDDGEERTVVTPEAMAARASSNSPQQTGAQGSLPIANSFSRAQGQTPGKGYGYDSGPFLEAGPRKAVRPD